MKVLISGGGTAGHINPALAIAGQFQQEKNAEILFIGTEKGLESKLVPQAGYDIRYIEVSGLIRKLTFKNFAVVKKFLTAISHSKKILREFQPDLVIGTGGYVCAPVLFAAHALKIPTVVHEQNVIPGVTVKMTAGICDLICISFSDTTNYLKPALSAKCKVTGNPIRQEMLSVSREAARKELGLDARPFIVAFGGSLGAQNLNNAVVQLLNKENTQAFQMMLGTGQRYFEEVSAALKPQGDNIRILPYINGMDKVMAAADLVIGRSGALTISELAALGKPSVLVPSPNVAHDHQTHNAKSMEKAGCSLLIPDSELSGKRLFSAISQLIAEPKRLSDMSENALKIAIADGAKRICDLSCELLK